MMRIYCINWIFEKFESTELFWFVVISNLSNCDSLQWEWVILWKFKRHIHGWRVPFVGSDVCGAHIKRHAHNEKPGRFRYSDVIRGPRLVFRASAGAWPSQPLERGYSQRGSYWGGCGAGWQSLGLLDPALASFSHLTLHSSPGVHFILACLYWSISSAPTQTGMIECSIITYHLESLF